MDALLALLYPLVDSVVPPLCSLGGSGNPSWSLGVPCGGGSPGYQITQCSKSQDAYSWLLYAEYGRFRNRRSSQVHLFRTRCSRDRLDPQTFKMLVALRRASLEHSCGNVLSIDACPQQIKGKAHRISHISVSCSRQNAFNR